jgi:hypothetical protein
MSLGQKTGARIAKKRHQNALLGLCNSPSRRLRVITSNLKLRLPHIVASNSFDPFDSLATENQRNTPTIIESLFQPVASARTKTSTSTKSARTAACVRKPPAAARCNSASTTRTTYLLLTTLLLTISTFCPNRTRIQANASAGRLSPPDRHHRRVRERK